MKTVLIIDDSTITRRLIARLLHAQGYETLEAENGVTGLDLISTQTPDCILLDIVMPEMDGIRFLKEAEERGLLRMPVIVMSADAQTPDRSQQLLRLGACKVVNKPSSGRSEFLEAIIDILPKEQ